MTSENLAELKFDIIKPNGNVSDFLTMKDNKSDGDYVLEFTRNGKMETKGYGYYTNGGALDRWVKFEIDNDTITQKFSEMTYLKFTLHSNVQPKLRRIRLRPNPLVITKGKSKPNNFVYFLCAANHIQNRYPKFDKLIIFNI